MPTARSRRHSVAAVIRPLFIIGNKRSGTSQLVRLLNLHPRVFVSHESDIVWALDQFSRERPFQAHPWDSDRGLRHTLEICGDLFRRERGARENFMAIQQRLMEAGTPFLPPQKKAGLDWIGDKKPFQHTDPQLLAFILEHFPDAHFLHIVRHPFEVAMSSARFNETANGDFWLGLSLEEKVARWTFHEQQVLRLRGKLPDRVHSLRYEDLCRRTEEELARVFQFLDLTADPAALREAARQTRPVAREVPVIRCSAETARIAGDYGYRLDSPTSRLRALGRNLSRRLSRQSAS
jgi:Sulfotransferase family